MPGVGDIVVGARLPERRETLDQAALIRYAGASGDLNPLHWDPAFAATVSPTGGIIAHGMLNLGLLGAHVTQWAGGPGRVLGIEVSFRAPCPVGATVVFGGEVLAVDATAATATLAIWAELDNGKRVIDRRRSRAVIRLDATVS